MESDPLTNLMLVPERAAAKKATAKFFAKSDNTTNAKNKPNTSNSTTKTSEAASNLNEAVKEVKESKKSSKKHQKRPPKSRSPSPDTEDEKIPEFEQPIVVYEGGYIPARKAAVKATTQMKDVDRKVSKKEEELLLFGEDPEKAKKAEEKSQKAHKKDHLPSLLENLRSPLSDSDSMDEEPFPFRSPRGKSSRGRTSGGQVITVNKFLLLFVYKTNI